MPLNANTGMESSLAATPQSPPGARISGLLQMANSYLQNGNLPQAQTTYQQVLQIDPHHTEAHHRLAVVADQFQNFSAAQNHYASALEGKPNDASLLSDVGYSYLLQENYANSEHYLKQALKVNPQHKQALNNLGLMYSKQNNYEQSLAMFRRAGSEQDAQIKMAQLFPNGQTGLTTAPAIATTGTPPANPGLNQNELSVDMTLSPSEQTQQLRELMERERLKSIAARQQKIQGISQAGQRTPRAASPLGSQVQNISQPQLQTIPVPRNLDQPNLQGLSAPRPQLGATNPLAQQVPPQFNNQAFPQPNNGFVAPPLSNSAGPAFTPAVPTNNAPPFRTAPTQTLPEQRQLPGFSQAPRNNTGDRPAINPLDSMPNWPAENSQPIQQTAATNPQSANPGLVIPEQWNGSPAAMQNATGPGVETAAFTTPSQRGQFIPTQIPQTALNQSTAQDYAIQQTGFDSLSPRNANPSGQASAQNAPQQSLEQSALLQGFNAGPGQPFPVYNNSNSQPRYQPSSSMLFAPPANYQGQRTPSTLNRQGVASQLGSSFPVPGRHLNSVVPASATLPQGASPRTMQQQSAIQPSRYAPMPGVAPQNTGLTTPQAVSPNGFPQTPSDYQATQDLLDQFEREIQQERSQFQQRP
jgi:Flp pilus assembly protein TadD